MNKVYEFVYPKFAGPHRCLSCNEFKTDRIYIIDPPSVVLNCSMCILRRKNSSPFFIIGVSEKDLKQAKLW